MWGTHFMSFRIRTKINYKGIILPYIEFVKIANTKYSYSNFYAENKGSRACLLVKGQAGQASSLPHLDN